MSFGAFTNGHKMKPIPVTLNHSPQFSQPFMLQEANFSNLNEGDTYLPDGSLINSYDTIQKSDLTYFVPSLSQALYTPNFNVTNLLQQKNFIHRLPNPILDENSQEARMITDFVPVPSTEHVAQIVGKNGLKIKTLRASTNTYIKTPTREQDPIFIVTGMVENVNEVRQTILEAAKHFTQVAQSKLLTKEPHEITRFVHVPEPLVGWVVGKRGEAILRIKEETNTRINTPRTGMTTFEVTGLPHNVEAAIEAIEERYKVKGHERLSRLVVQTDDVQSGLSAFYVANNIGLFDPPLSTKWNSNPIGQNQTFQNGDSYSSNSNGNSSDSSSPDTMSHKVIGFIGDKRKISFN